MALIKGRGGAREGAGRKSNWTTSETTLIRVPALLKERLLEFARELDHPERHQVYSYKAICEMIAFWEDRLARYNSDCETESEVLDTPDIPDSEEIIQLLEEALKLKANAGGAIKVKIREAIALLKKSAPSEEDTAGLS